METGALLRTIETPVEGLPTVRFSGRGRYVVVSSGDGLTAWNPATGEQAFVLEKEIGYVHDFAFSRDGRRMAAALRGREGGIRLWDLETGGMERTLGDPENRAMDAAFDPSGRYVAALCGGHAEQAWEVRIWEVQGGREVCRLPAPDNSSLLAWSGSRHEIVVTGREDEAVVHIYGRK